MSLIGKTVSTVSRDTHLGDTTTKKCQGSDYSESQLSGYIGEEDRGYDQNMKGPF